MNALKTIAPLLGALALSAAPALAVNEHAPDGAGTPPSNQGTAHQQTNTPGPKASLPSKAKAYGKYCQGQSKKRDGNGPGTPFSRCVTAMAKVAHDQASANKACSTESKKKAAGADRSSFSMCVSGAAKLKHDQKSSS
jgi:hypothetical protein